MIQPSSAPTEYSGSRTALDAPARLEALTVRMAALEASGVALPERFRIQTEGVAAVVSAVHRQEVVAPRDELWQDISEVVQRAMPFAVDQGPGRVAMTWNFHDARYPFGGSTYPEVSDVAVDAVMHEAVAGSKAFDDVRMALRYASADHTAPRYRLPDAILGLKPERDGYFRHAFDQTDLTRRAAAEVIAQTRLIQATSHARYDYGRPARDNRFYPLNRQQLDRAAPLPGSIDAAADWLALRPLTDPAIDVDVTYELSRELYDHGAETPAAGYDYLYETYVAPGKERVDEVRMLNRWLQQPSIVAVTPQSLAELSAAN